MSDGGLRSAVKIIENRIAILAFAFMISSSALASAQAGHSADDAAIRAQAREYAEAFASGAADKLADLWAESAIFVDQEGNVFRGRSEIKKRSQAFFARGGGQPLEIVVESISFPGDDVAIEEGISRLKNSSAPDACAHYVATHVKRDGKWVMETVTESPYQALSNGEYLKPLSFLLGNWKAEGPRGVLQMKSNWVNKNVIEINVEAAPKDAAKSVLSEFIYWNPRARCINSWQFDENGGTSRKWWEKDGDNWIVHANSVQADGSESRADYILRQIDSDNLSWQSRRRSISGAELPDTEQIKVTRVKS